MLSTSVIGAATPAGAEIAPPGVNMIAAAGSDTSEAFMDAYLNGKTTSTNGTTTWNVQTYNIPALGGTKTVPGDADCPNGQITYGPATNNGSGVGSQYTSTGATTLPLPNGSSAGRRFLVDERLSTNPDVACVDIARSSSGPPFSGEGSTFQYFAFALDAVTWATQSPYAPATLTAAQLDGIYNCTITNWNQVGGLDGPIQRVMPQDGSGTRSFFMSTFGILLDELNTTAAGCPATITAGIQENEGTAIPDSVKATAIVPYSAGRWAYQSTNRGNPTLDKRDEIRLGGFSLGAGTGAKLLPIEYSLDNFDWQLDTTTNGAIPATVVESNILLANPGYNANTDFRGVRYLFNVIDTNSPSYNVSRGLIGFNNVTGGVSSPLCGAGSAVLPEFGFARLTTANPQSANEAGTRCRRFLGTG